jgi:hypothetical protein
MPSWFWKIMPEHHEWFERQSDRPRRLRGPGHRYRTVENKRCETSPQEAEMRKLAVALALFASPALAETPNLSPGPPLEGVPDPVVCLPIGKTAKGDLVYSMDCRDIPASTGVNPVSQPIAPSLPSEKAAAPPEKK